MVNTSNFDTHVLVSNTPLFPLIGCTTYDYARLGQLPLCILRANGSLHFIHQEDASTLFALSVAATLTEEQLHCNITDPPLQHRDLFLATLDSLPEDPVIFSHEYVSQALENMLMQITYPEVTPETIHSLASHILSHRISSCLSSFTHPLQAHHSLQRPYRTFVFPPTPSPGCRTLPLGPCTIHIQDIPGGQIGLLSEFPTETSSSEGPIGLLLCISVTVETPECTFVNHRHLLDICRMHCVNIVDTKSPCHVGLMSLHGSARALPMLSNACIHLGEMRQSQLTRMHVR